MPTYQYYNKKTKKHFTENLPLHKRKFPCRDPFVELSITAPNLSIISDNGGKEDRQENRFYLPQRGDIKNEIQKKN